MDCPTEASKGGARLYVAEKYDFKQRADLMIYKTKELESVFIEANNKKGKNLIVGCIYRYPCMSVDEFNNDYFNKMLEKINKEKKDIILMGDFNINLLNHDSKSDTHEFLNLIQSFPLTPHILKPTRITNRTKTLIDNIFSSLISNQTVSGNQPNISNLGSFTTICHS